MAPDTWSGIGPSGAEVLPRAITTMGTAGFGPALMGLGRQWFDAVQVVAFHIDAAMICSTMLAENLGGGETMEARALADDYRRRFRSDDPNRDLLTGADATLCRTVHAEHIGPADYREALFDKPRLGSKIAMLARHRRHTFYLNFYRGVAQRPFQANDLERLRATSGTLLALLDRHHRRDNRATDGDAAIRDVAAGHGIRLSAREHHVCALLLDGLSMRAIAETMKVSDNSAISYRRRAFVKLGIATQKELFALALASARS